MYMHDDGIVHCSYEGLAWNYKTWTAHKIWTLTVIEWVPQAQVHVQRSLEQLDSVCNKLSADGTVVYFLSTVPAELVAAQEGRVSWLCQTYWTVGTTSSSWAQASHLNSYKYNINKLLLSLH